MLYEFIYKRKYKLIGVQFSYFISCKIYKYLITISIICFNFIENIDLDMVVAMVVAMVIAMVIPMVVTMVIAIVIVTDVVICITIVKY